MAEHTVIDAETDADFAEHVRTYRLFLKLIKFGLLTVVIILITLAVVTH